MYATFSNDSVSYSNGTIVGSGVSISTYDSSTHALLASCRTGVILNTKRNGGFTLLEVLLAITLLGVVAAALYGSYFTVVRARERVAEGSEARRELGATLDLIRRECGAALYRRGDKKLRLMVEDRDFFGKPASVLEITTLIPPTAEHRKESGISLVRYQLNDAEQKLKDAPRILTRREQDLFMDSDDMKPYPQMERISAFLVECYDGSKWVKSWDTALNNRLPSMIRVTLMVEEQGKQLEYSALAPLRVNAQ